ncbi:MAG TPA: OsmC family protein [Longimicrobiales bacterium]
MSEQSSRQPMVITHEGGVKFAAQIRQHKIVVDQPERGGGEDSAPMPLELLGASLGTCVALYVQQFCHARNLPYQGMRVEVDPRGAQGRIGRFGVRVIMPEALPAHYAEMLERVARSCPAHNTLAHGAEVAIEIEQPAARS